MKISQLEIGKLYKIFYPREIYSINPLAIFKFPSDNMYYHPDDKLGFLYCGNMFLFLSLKTCNENLNMFFNKHRENKTRGQWYWIQILSNNIVGWIVCPSITWFEGLAV